MLEKAKKLLNDFVSRLRAGFSLSDEQNISLKQRDLEKNFNDFIKEEKREFQELADGREDASQYLNDSWSLFKDYFIPGDNNDNRPKILRPRPLAIIAIILVLSKIGLAGYVFSVYQRQAMMAETAANQMLALTNESRAASGISPLDLNPVLSQAAQVKAEDMVIKGYFSHTSPDGRKPWDFVSRSQYPYILIGENLAMNFLGSSDAHAALMASPSHQKNILNPKYTDLGIAVIQGEINGEETSVLVEMFGAQAETAKPAEPVIEPSLAAAVPAQPADSAASAPAQVVVKSETEAAMPVSEAIGTSAVAVSAPLAPLAAGVGTSSEIKTIDGDAPSVYSPETLASSAEAVALESYDQASGFEAEIATAPVMVEVGASQSVDRALTLLDISKIIYIIFLAFLIIALGINIFIRIRVQHKPVIVQALLLIALVLALCLFDFGFIREMQSRVRDVLVF